MKKKADVGHINHNDAKIHLLERQLKNLLQVIMGIMKTSLAKSVQFPKNESVNDTADILNQLESIFTKFSQDSDKINRKKL